MSRRPGARDVLVSLALTVAMQVQLLNGNTRGERFVEAVQRRLRRSFRDGVQHCRIRAAARSARSAFLAKIRRAPPAWTTMMLMLCAS